MISKHTSNLHVSCLIIFSSQTFEDIEQAIFYAQSLTKFIIIVRPESSAQHDENILRSCSESIILTDRMEGPEAAINMAVSHVTTSHFCLVFPGDYLVTVGVVESVSDNVCIYPQLYSESKDGLKSPRFKKVFFRRFAMPSINLIGAFLPTKAFLEVGGFPRIWKVSNDHLLINRLMDYGIEFKQSSSLRLIFKKGGISDVYYERGLAESACLSGGFWVCPGFLLNLMLCIKNGRSPRVFVTAFLIILRGRFTRRLGGISII